ncbi:MAG TPA: DUF6691 family protein [Kofleriaceae bacterium]|nr:DUF6691 family protein [Kofleriaceae bacterium]
MNRAILPLLSGAIFGAGVCVSGMVRPSKVLGFLDFGGAWDASLLVVMAAALSLHVVAWQIVKRSRAPRYGTAFPDPPSKLIDMRLLGGAAVFGVGWGISGFCPGPAVISVLSGSTASFVFVGAMGIAMVLFDASKSDG